MNYIYVERCNFSYNHIKYAGGRQKTAVVGEFTNDVERVTHENKENFRVKLY